MSKTMSRSFASYFVEDVEMSEDEREKLSVFFYLIIGVLPLSIFLISSLLFWITKRAFFKKIIKWCLAIFTRGIIEQIFMSTIKYVKATKNDSVVSEIPYDQRLHRVNGTIFTKINAKRIKRSAALLFPFQAYIFSMVLAEQLFVMNQSSETCQTYQTLENKSFYLATCSFTRKSIPNIPAAEFFNPRNAFRSVPEGRITNLTHLCSDLNILRNETLWKDHHIHCTRHYIRWNNIINTLTNVLQWQQITVFIIKVILNFTFSWQNTLGHSHWWLARSRMCRFFILLTCSISWTATFVIYVLIILAFNNALRASQVILSLQTGVVLLIPLFGIPLLLYNALTLFHWAIRTVHQKKCEQEVSCRFNSHRQVLFYTDDNKTLNV